MNQLWVYKIIEVLEKQTTVATSLSLCAVNLDRYIAVTNIRYCEILTCKRIRTSKTVDRWNDNNSHLAGAPCLVISICYFYTLKAARVRIKRITKNEACSVNGDEAVAQLKKSKAVFTVGIVVGVFLVCWTSSLVISFVQFFCNDP
ncbi:hypothetical protein P5673_012968, partial [Acropora cervicornis]